VNKPVLSEGQGKVAVWLFSFLLLGIIAFLYLGPKLIVVGGLSASTLPKVNAVLNAAAALVLITAWRAILRKQVQLHRRLMLTAVAISAVFLACYVVQHGSFPSVKYGGSAGWLYYPVLISHIILAAAIVPLVLITLVRALSNRFDKHRRIARWTLPLWLYVSVTGVVVYLMCAPYY
jgi:putative membrane protein